MPRNFPDRVSALALAETVPLSRSVQDGDLTLLNAPSGARKFSDLRDSPCRTGDTDAANAAAIGAFARATGGPEFFEI